VTTNFAATLAQRPGLVPIELNPQTRGIAWGDIGSFELRQSFYDWGLRDCHETLGIKSITQTPISVLKQENLIGDAVAPSGFIFHMARCGSSLLAKALAHGQGNLVISEPEPLNQLLFLLTDNFPAKQIGDQQRLQMLRTMILALGRTRGLDKQRYFLKFSSWNVLLATTISRLFPQVPCLFLYRNPQEVMVSIERTPTGFVQARPHRIGEALCGLEREQLDQLSPQQYVAAVLARMAAAAIELPQMHFLDYQYINAQYFPQLLDFFAYQPEAASLQAMGEQFQYDSKQARGVSSFSADGASKQAAATPAIQQACEQWLRQPLTQIQASDRNLL